MPNDDQDANDLAAMKLRASTDQGAASAAVMAELLGAYFRALLSEGFTREEAHVLVGDWQDAVLRRAVCPRPKP